MKIAIAHGAVLSEVCASVEYYDNIASERGQRLHSELGFHTSSIGIHALAIYGALLTPFEDLFFNFPK